ncbi:toll/interleukin-1 receptor domain-containing protein [Flavisolibacter ginsenosidimutans]|uniref:Toll/interleukin-1 receptor domain-containing protein n=1 Tax=Flavisolibacter ginsenosidimutans TaxID=661481 RepID=A0A5B8UIZ1_9BACT|nr:toll/interleukin-1 receptor domain-containing protein [Flavisolibacter ginsenosidimutans]QEC56644.1 toll/interleukin-1 receptor domain-containing protein [Flavisolibacter ginsenosidimutans]
MMEGPIQPGANRNDKELDRNLDVLIEEIGKGNVVPIIGTDIIKVQDGKRYDLMEYLLLNLEGKYDSKFDYKKHNCDSPFEKLNHIHSVTSRPPKQGFYIYIKEIMADAENKYDTTYLDLLAKIRKFKLFINASSTTILEKSVRKNRAFITSKHDAFTLNITDSPLQDIEIESAINSISPVLFPKKLKKTVVYNLYGKYDKDDTGFIVVDDDILELIHSISVNRDKLNTLFELLSSSSLLFIGCNFPDWLLRFFIRMFSKQKLSVSSSLYSVADIINSDVDRNRAIFIKNSSIKYFEFNGEVFIQRLFDKISAKKPKWIRNNANIDYLFLSYATENQRQVIDIYEKLDDKDFDVFMDIRDIDHGEQIRDEVKKAIDNCKIFIPIISKETDTMSTNERFFKKEWDYVLEIHNRENPNNEIGKKPVILPIFLNQIKYNELKETTPKTFFDLKYQGASAENGLSSAFINKIAEIIG